MERDSSLLFYLRGDFIAKTLSEEAKRKRTITFYNKAIEKARSEIGNKYNRLTIMNIDYEKSQDSYFNKKCHDIYVKTKCDCGKTPPSVRLKSIKSGHTKSCGCLKFNNSLNFEDLTGRKFGRLTVIGRDLERDMKKYEEGLKTRVHWLCKCDCGNPQIRSVLSNQLKAGHTKSCGCYASEQIAERNKKYSTKINNFIDNNDGTYWLLDDSNNKCLIDKEDYEVVRKWYWKKISKRGDINKGYWETNVKVDDKYDKAMLKIHQLIAEIKYGEYKSSNLIPDHLSRDTDDNRKCNIILKTNQENSHNRGLSKINTSGKTGVSLNRDKNMWCAYITVGYKTKHLGCFSKYEDAVKVRKEAEEKYKFTCDDIVSEYDKGAD